MKKIFFLFVFSMLHVYMADAQDLSQTVDYWNARTLLIPYRLPTRPGHDPSYEDLDGDGDPDILYTILSDGVPVMWIDDDDDMQFGDTEGDTDNDCLLIDRNRDGVYGGYGDLIIDWIGEDEAGNPAMQVVVDNPAEDQRMKSSGHYMVMVDTDRDRIFSYIDWRTLQLRCWLHSGLCDFFTDYQGKSLFLKIHSTPERMNDLRMNWENPFLFYDPDSDGLTEMAVRMCDTPAHRTDKGHKEALLKGTIDWVSLTVDMDNDNAPGKEFDFDMTLHFSGPGFDYTDQVHRNSNLRGLPEADRYFMDPRWRQRTELFYPDHDSAWELIFKRGKWDRVWFSYDEDDDCHRWERVELYQPGEPFKTGAWQGGPDNNPQSDPAGDRGEWDEDNSGGGRLYVSFFDGKIHLYGAEWGLWRIDQESRYYQGMGALYDGYGPERIWKEPTVFPTMRYLDTDNNGFFDLIEYDLDGDSFFEESVSLTALGLDDKCAQIDISSFAYSDFAALQKRVAESMWDGAKQALEVAELFGLNTSWYSLMMSPKSLREKYHYGYWLGFYIYRDLRELLTEKKEHLLRERLDKAYYGGRWDDFL